MRRKIKKGTEPITFRGNDINVVSKFRLEMRLVRNLNKEKPIYSFESEEKVD